MHQIRGRRESRPAILSTSANRPTYTEVIVSHLRKKLCGSVVSLAKTALLHPHPLPCRFMNLLARWLLVGKDQTAHVALTFSLAFLLPAVYISGIVRLNINSWKWAQFSLMDRVQMCVCVFVCIA